MKSHLEEMMELLRDNDSWGIRFPVLHQFEIETYNKLILSGLYGYFAFPKVLHLYEKQKTSFRSFAFKIHVDEQTIQSKAKILEINNFIEKWMIKGVNSKKAIIKHISVYSRIHYILSIPSFLYIIFMNDVNEIGIKEITEIGKEIGTIICPHCNAIVINTNNSIAECPNGHKFTV